MTPAHRAKVKPLQPTLGGFFFGARTLLSEL